MKQSLKDDLGSVFYRVEYWENKHIVYSTWISTYLSIEQVKQGALLGLEKIKECNSTLLLNDNRQLEGSWDGANDWIAEEWMPKAIEAGLLKFAHIVPEDIYAKLSAEFMKDATNENASQLELRLFDNQEDAEAWLLENHKFTFHSKKQQNRSKH